MTKITKFCVDCGKERTDYECNFGKISKEYRCHSCSAKHQKYNKTWVDNFNAAMKTRELVTYSCIKCGKERTAFPNQFSKPREEYICFDCWKHLDRVPRVTYACIDCKEERTAHIWEFNKPREEYRCTKCALKFCRESPDWSKNMKDGIIKRSSDPEWKKNQKDGIEEFNKTKRVYKIVTYKCIYCGKERTAHKTTFKKPQEEYVCRSCYYKILKAKSDSKKVTYKCTVCGKEKTDYPCAFKHSIKETYKCEECARKTSVGKVIYKCIDCGEESTPKCICHFSKPEDEYRCDSCAKKIKRNRIICKCSICNTEKIGTPSYFKGIGDPYKCNKCRNSEFAVIAKNNWSNLLFVEKYLVGVYGQGFWYGHPSINKYSPVYCELWKDVNPRVHAFFNYKCCLCGVSENGRSHTGHHVFYVKEACCWKTEDGIYYTNLNARDHKENDYLIGPNPNYFVILCQSCHSRTNGNFENRRKWADYFKDMIDVQYDGKCYLTKEEMENFKGNNIFENI